MNNLQEYVKPELLVLIPVLYVIGMMMKNTEKVKDKFIPAILGCVGVALSTLYVLGSEGLTVLSIFTAITQGVLVAGASVYVNQLIKQAGEE